MKIGNLDIKKAFLGSLPLTSKNAYIGNYKVISGDEPGPEPVGIDYFWIQPLEDTAIDMNVETGLAKTMPNMEYSFNKTTWNKFADIHKEESITPLSELQAANPNTIYCALSQKVKKRADEMMSMGERFRCTVRNEDGMMSQGNATYIGQLTDGRYLYSYNSTVTPYRVNIQIGFMLSVSNIYWGSMQYYDWQVEEDWEGTYNKITDITDESINATVWDTINVSANTKVYLRNTKTWKCSQGKATKIVLQNVRYNIGGDIETIQDYNNMVDVITEVDKYAYLFYEDKNIINADELKLNYKTLGSNSFDGTFYYCTNLITAPELPATLVDVCSYQNMFGYCKNLIKAPSILPATIRDYSYYCYRYMFKGCSSLTKAPELPSTTGSDECYNQMFAYCSSLVTPPSVLPISGIKFQQMYYLMFWNCSSLQKSPEIMATKVEGSDSLSRMFENCSKLSEVYVHFEQFYKDGFTSDWNGAFLTDWLDGVASSGTLYNLGGATNIPSSTSGCPTGWTIKTSKP